MSSAVFDLDKLRWVNAQHLRMRPPVALRPLVLQDLCTGDNPILPASALQDSYPSAQFDTFMECATLIAQRDMEVLTDSKRLVANCLAFDLDAALRSDPHVEEILHAESFPAVVDALLGDYQSGTMPSGTEADFAALWNI